MKNSVKTISAILMLLQIPVFLEAGNPLCAVSGVRPSHTRSAYKAEMLDKNIQDVIASTGIFDVVETAIVKKQLTQYGCIEEKCVLRFAKTAGISVIISGSLQEKGDSLSLSLSSYGLDFPYSGRKIHTYEAEIVFNEKPDLEKTNRIFREHALRFAAKTLSVYEKPVYIKAGEKSVLESDINISGSFYFYRARDRFLGETIYEKAGKIEVSANLITESSGRILENDFILYSNVNKAEAMEEYFYSIKRNSVFARTPVSVNLLEILLTVPASVTMPIAAPLLGYYHNSDWNGLMLWGINAVPWISLQYYGILNSPDSAKKEGRSVSENVPAAYYFGWYMFYTGGASLFADAFSHGYLREAALYQKRHYIMGDTFTAVYLSLVSGGGGLFYRGHRAWGYAYFHLNNTLIFLTLRELFPQQRRENGQWKTDPVNKTMAWTLGGIYGAVKLAEMIHAALIRDDIYCGEVSEQYFSLAPFFDFSSGGLTAGASLILRL